MKQPRLNNFLLGFCACLGMFFLMGLTQNSVRFKDETSIAKEFQNLYENVQGRQHTIVTSTPIYQNLREGEIFVQNGDVKKRLVTRIQNTLYYWTEDNEQSFTVYTDTPTAASISEGKIFVVNNEIETIWTKIGADLYYANLTKW